MSELTYPISPDYVKSWTPERAIAELIANALDEDPDATATWANGVLTIEDNGPGIPEEGMILGYSPKDETNIGQFGEGAKVASLVLARSENIGAVRVETVGYGFTPTAQTRRILDGVAPRRSEQPPQVLVYTFIPSARTTGTRVSIECDEAVADAAISRFRTLTEPGYRRPTDTAHVILGGPTGRLFIGGVLVSTQPRLLASYDFPLAGAKRAQNRDRTVIDTETMTTMVTAALSSCSNHDVIRHFVQHVVNGGRLNDAEKYFASVNDPRVRAAFLAVSRAMFSGRAVFYTDRGVDETALDLLDGDYEIITTNVDHSTQVSLMRLLDIKQARVVAAQRPDHRTNTKFIALSRLTAAERDTLENAVTTCRTLFGKSAVDKVKVFTETGDRYLACADGFYTPNSGGIALRRDILTDPVRTMEVMVHEVGHRRAHRRGGEFADRTRGFETELGNMLAAVAVALAQRDPNATVEPEQDPGVAVPATRANLASLLTAALPQALAKAGVRDEKELSDSVGMHRNYLRLLTDPKPAGWRRPPGSMAPAVVADPRHLEVLASATGVHMSALWLGHMLCEGPRYGRTRNAPAAGPWSKRITSKLDPVLAELDTLGGVYAHAADRVRALAAGESIEMDDPNWQEFALDVLAAERERLALEDHPVVAHPEPS